jgi:hypothetical protein
LAPLLNAAQTSDALLDLQRLARDKHRTGCIPERISNRREFLTAGGIPLFSLAILQSWLITPADPHRHRDTIIQPLPPTPPRTLQPQFEAESLRAEVEALGFELRPRGPASTSPVAREPNPPPPTIPVALPSSSPLPPWHHPLPAAPRSRCHPSLHPAPLPPYPT